MRNLSWEDYLKALASNDASKYYEKKYGSHEGAALVVDYHMNKKELTGLDDFFLTSKDIDKMVFGQFIMSEKALTSGLKKEEALYNLSLAILRPITDKEFDNTDAEKEEAHIINVINFDAAEVLNELESYVEMREEFVNSKYNGVFYVLKTDDDDDDIKEEEGEEEEEEELSDEEKFSSQWYWYSIVRSLAGENLWDYERILMTPMSDIAPELAYRRHKQLIEEAQRKRVEALNRVQK